MNLHLLNECVLTCALLEEKGCPRDSVAVFPFLTFLFPASTISLHLRHPKYIPNTDSLDLKFRLILSGYNFPGEEETVFC